MRLLSTHRHFWIACVLLMTGCTLNNVSVSTETTSGVPTVRIVSPQPNATYLEGVAVNIQATVSNAGKDIDRVEIVIDGATAATLSQPNPNGVASFNVTHGWSAAGAGAHNIDVTAYRADGSSSTPATVSITVVAQSGQPTQSLAAGSTQPSNPTQQQQIASTPDNSQPTANPSAVAATSAPTTVAASATPTQPTATFVQGINVRRGPGTEFDPPIGAFAAGQSTEILALNPAGTWYKVRYGGGEGWVSAAPALTTASGDMASLPRDPGPPVPTPAPPTAVPATQPPPPPATSANLVAGIVVLDPSQPTCAQTFNIGFDVANLGSEPTAASGTISVEDKRSADGSIQGTTIGGFPVLQPGQTFRVNMPLTISTWYNEAHAIRLIIDPNNQIPETNEGDNLRDISYTLQKGSCP